MMAVYFRHGRVRARAGYLLSRLRRLLSNSLGCAVPVTSNVRDTAGQQKSAKPKAQPPGDRDFEAVRTRGARSGIPRRIGNRNTNRVHYAASGFVDCTEDASGARTLYEYDAKGRRTAVTDALGNTVYTAYDGRGNITAQWGATYPVSYEYDAQGRMVQMGTYRGAAEITDYAVFQSLVSSFDKTVWLYDQPTGLLTNKVYADGLGPSYTYTPGGKLLSRVWARGVATVYAYDGFNRPVSVDYSDGTPDIDLAYDVFDRLVSVTDASGSRALAHTPDGQVLSDTLSVGDASYALVENYDAFGRSSGYALSNIVNGTSAPITGADFAYDGADRIETVAVPGISAPFRYAYLLGSDLVQTLAMPNGVTRETGYGPHGGFSASITHTNANGAVLTYRTFTRDAADRLTARTQYRVGDETNRLDFFDYNLRSELTQAAIGTDDYAYLFDPIGNREQSIENAVTNLYAANNLNQYTSVSNPVNPVIPADNEFLPAFDADGNQTLIRTSTGVWHVFYNAENRPVCFSNDIVVIDMDYDYKGRRFFYRETANNAVIRHERHLYRGYLRIVALDMLDGGSISHSIVWEPTESTATRPLLLSMPSGWHTYGFDQVKNVTELFDASGAISATYDYAPFGAVTKSSDSAVFQNPVTFSSEIEDSMLGLVYYNWRHLNTLDGRWVNRDPVYEKEGKNIYFFLGNNCLEITDFLGLMRHLTKDPSDCDTKFAPYLKSLIDELNDAKTWTPFSSKLTKLKIELGGLHSDIVTIANVIYNGNMEMVGSMIEGLILNLDNPVYDFIADQVLTAVDRNQVGQYLSDLANNVKSGGECARLANEMMENIAFSSAVAKISKRINDIFDGIANHCPCLARENQKHMKNIREHWSENETTITAAVEKSRENYQKKCGKN